MSEISYLGYLRMDFLRLVRSKRLFIAIVGVVFSLFFSLEDRNNFGQSVLYMFQISTAYVGFMVSFVFCAYAYGFCLGEDLESAYIRYTVIRGNRKQYIVSKIIVIFASSVFVMTMGCLLFALLCHIWLPWQDSFVYLKDPSMTMFGFFIENNMTLIWICIFGLLNGVCGGILTLVSAYFSLYVSNKMLILVVPVLIFQLIADISSDFSWQHIFSPHKVFNIGNNALHFTHGDGIACLWAIVYALLLSVAIGIAIYQKAGKKL